MLHLHGENPMFELQARYPANVLNWHDRRAAPHLAEGEQQSGRCVCGGINERQVAERSPTAIAKEARDAVAQTGGRHLIVGPGCVIPGRDPRGHHPRRRRRCLRVHLLTPSRELIVAS